MPASIAVQADEVEADAIVGHQEEEEPADGRDGHADPMQPAGEASMQDGNEPQEGDERPGLFRIPSSVAAPRGIRPHRTQHDPCGKQNHADLNHPIERVP